MLIFNCHYSSAVHNILRQSQQDAMKREEELKNQITQSQRSIENKLNRITTALEKMNGLGAVEATMVAEAPSEKKQDWVGVRKAPPKRKKPTSMKTKRKPVIKKNESKKQNKAQEEK